MILYFDCFAGISGDMTVGALLDLGLPLAELEGELAKLGIPRSSWSVSSEQVVKKGLRATKFHVRVEEHQPHRHYAGIAAMIEESALAEGVKARAQKILYRLAEAESRVHGVPMEKVHFHEVGALDSIIDIVGAAWCLERLGVERLYASALPLGGGFVTTAHGLLPVPAPATAELMQGMPVVPGPGPGERVTPTGAAIVAALAAGFGPPPQFLLEKTGHGAGDRDFPEVPNVLRILAGTERRESSTDEVYLLETNLDDCTAEELGYLMERLLEEGALDVSFSPLQMKKNRPATKVSILVPVPLLEPLARLVLRESSAIGVRYHVVKRIMLQRSIEEVKTPLGPVRVKVLRDGEAVVRRTAEFDDCRRIAREKGVPLREVMRAAEEGGPK